MDNDDIQRLVAEDRLIEAIKAYRERHGVGLKEAKDAVDAMARDQANTPMGPIETAAQVYDALHAALFSGQTIEAIKLWRKHSGEGLKDSKEFIDQLEAELREESPEKFTAAPRRLGCAGVLAFLAIGAAVAIWHLA